MNTQVQAKAKELAQAIASSPEYIAMRLAEEDMEEDAQLQERFIDYNEKKQALEDLMTQDSPDQEAVRRASEAFEEAQKTIRATPASKRYRYAAQVFKDMMKEVNQELQQLLDPSSGTDRPCSGNCSSCGSDCPLA